MIYEIIDKVIPAKVEGYFEQEEGDSSDFSELINWANTTFPIHWEQSPSSMMSMGADEISTFIISKVKAAYELKVQVEDPALLDQLERHIVMVSIDKLWQEHLYNMDALREGVGLRAQGQKDPLVEYKNEAYNLFVTLWDRIEAEVLGNLFRSTTNLEKFEQFLHNLPLELNDRDSENAGGIPSPGGGQATGGARGEGGQLKLNIPKRRPSIKVGRNEPCPCGSGKKYKACCGRQG
jgi:preprotein translocase subunit SecA